MKLYINDSDYISVVKYDYGYVCQLMRLMNSDFSYLSSIIENEEIKVSTVIEEDYIYSETNLIFDSLEEVIQYHTNCVFEYYRFRDEN